MNSSSCVLILTQPIVDFSEVKFESHITKVVASGIGLQSFKGIPDDLNVEEMDVSDNQIASLQGAPKSLKRLRCSKNKISTLKGLHEGLISLGCSFNHLTNLDGCPSTVTDLVAVHCFIKDMSHLPKTRMNRVYLAYNEIEKPNLPASAKIVDLSCNLLAFAEIHPSGIDELMLCNNDLRELIVKTEDLKILRVSGGGVRWLKVYNKSKSVQLIQAKKNFIAEEDVELLHWVKELYI